LTSSANEWWILKGSDFGCEVAKYGPEDYIKDGTCTIKSTNERLGIVKLGCNTSNLVYFTDKNVCLAFSDKFKKKIQE